MRNKESNDLHKDRHAGLLLPLFSAAGHASWGIGEFNDLPVLCSWMRSAALDFLQVLPLNEMASGQHSPYSAISAMALDPIFISVAAVAEFEEAGGEQRLADDARQVLERVRSAKRIEYNAVRELKMTVLRAAFTRFVEVHWVKNSPRAMALRHYMERERWWIDDYILFRALRDRYEGRPWWDWDAPLARRDAAALDQARASLDRDCLFFAYLQWIADEQWHEARRVSWPVGIFGDLPFMVGSDSADVWANQHAFRLDATVGAPPDAFSETGQDWGLPVYRWDVFEIEDDAWIRLRARRNAALFDGYRVDHLVGFYRTYVIPKDGSPPGFSPPEELRQLAQGERLMRLFAEPGARIIAEDLGTVPDFVRASLLRLGVPGYKVLRWEREWKQPGQPFRDIMAYPSASVATTGTHDTETAAEWWETAPVEERRLLATTPFFAEHHLDPENPQVQGRTLDLLLEALVASSSDLVIIPLQDVFGWRDRINVPATVVEDNWTWRLPWPVEDILENEEAEARALALRGWMRQHNRSKALFRRRNEPERSCERRTPGAPNRTRLEI